MALVICDNLYMTATLHAKKEKLKVVKASKVGIPAGLRQSHACNTGITKNKGKDVSKATSQIE